MVSSFLHILILDKDDKNVLSHLINVWEFWDGWSILMIADQRVRHTDQILYLLGMCTGVMFGKHIVWIGSIKEKNKTDAKERLKVKVNM